MENGSSVFGEVGEHLQSKLDLSHKIRRGKKRETIDFFHFHSYQKITHKKDD
jgi:hypothetical protein